MKKVILLVILAMLITPIVRADSLSLTDLLKKLPDLKQGIIYDVEAKDICYVSTAEVLNYKNFALEVGYAPEDSLLAVVSYPVLKLKDLGIDTPILNLIEFNVGMGAGLSRIGSGGGNNEFVWGPVVSLIRVKF